MKPITRGRIASIDGSFGVDGLEDVTGQNTLNGRPSSAVNVTDQGTLPTGQRWAAGEMARRTEERVAVPQISEDGTVELTHEDQVLEGYSAWAMVPGEFAIGWTDWSFKFLKWNFPVWQYSEQLIGLTSFYRDNNFSNVGSVGFKARRDAAEKGTVHGQNVTSDEAIGEDLREESYLNELRFKYHPAAIHEPVKAYIAASGYVEVYNPGEMTTEQFLSYVREEVLPYTHDADDD
jgi:hypothetical protein